jgi:hypothetical protein
MDERERMTAKLAILRRDAERLTALARSDADAASEARTRLARQRDVVATTRAAATRPGCDPEGERRADAEVAALDEEARVLTDIARASSERASALRRLVRRCEEYLGARALADVGGSWEVPVPQARTAAQKLATRAEAGR